MPYIAIKAFPKDAETKKKYDQQHAEIAQKFEEKKKAEQAAKTEQ